MDLFEKDNSLITLEQLQNESGIQATDIMYMLVFTESHAYPGRKLHYIEQGNEKFFSSDAALSVKDIFAEFNSWRAENYDEKGRANARTEDKDEDFEYDREEFYNQLNDNEEESTETATNEEEQDVNTDDEPIDLIDNQNDKKNKKKKQTSKKSVSNYQKLEKSLKEAERLRKERERLVEKERLASADADVTNIREKIREIDYRIDVVSSVSAQIAEESRYTGEKEKAFFENCSATIRNAAEEKNDIGKQIDELKERISEKIDKISSDADTQLVEATKALDLASGGNGTYDIAEKLSKESIDETYKRNGINNTTETYEAHNIANVLTENRDAVNLDNVEEYIQKLHSDGVIDSHQPPQNVVDNNVGLKQTNYDVEKELNVEKTYDDKKKYTTNDEYVNRTSPEAIPVNDVNTDKAYITKQNELSESPSENQNPLSNPVTNIDENIKKYFTGERKAEINNECDSLKKDIEQLAKLYNEYREADNRYLSATREMSVFQEQASYAKDGVHHSVEYLVRNEETVNHIVKSNEKIMEDVLSFAMSAEAKIDVVTYKSNVAYRTFDVAETIVGINKSDFTDDAAKKEQIQNCFVNLSVFASEEGNTLYNSINSSFSETDSNRVVTIQSIVDNHIANASESRAIAYSISDARYYEMVSESTQMNTANVIKPDLNRAEITYEYNINRDKYINDIFSDQSLYVEAATTVRAVQNAIALSAPEHAAEQISKNFNESNLANIAKEKNVAYVNKEKTLNARSDTITVSTEKANLSDYQTALLQIEKASNTIISGTNQTDSLIKAFVKDRAVFVQDIQMNSLLSDNAKAEMLLEYDKTAKEILVTEISKFKQDEWFANKAILDNVLVLEKLKLGDTNTPEAKMEIAKLNAQHEKLVSNLNVTYTKDQEKLERDVDIILTGKKANKDAKVIANGTNLKDFDSDNIVSGAKEKQSNTQNGSLLNQAQNSKETLGNPSLAASKTKELPQGKSGDALKAAQEGKMILGYDYHWASMNRTVESAGKALMTGFGNVGRSAMQGTELYSGFQTIAPLMSIPTTIIITNGLRNILEQRSNDVIGMYGSIANRNALTALFQQRGFTNIDMRHVSIAQLDELFAGSEIVKGGRFFSKAKAGGTGKLSELSNKQLKKLLASDFLTDAERGAISKLLHSRQTDKFRNALGRQRMKSSRYIRRLGNTLFNGTEAGEGYEDIKRLYNYARKTFSTTYKTLRFVGRHLLNFNSWARGKRIQRLEKAISKGRRVARNTRKLTRISTRQANSLARRKAVSNISGRIRNAVNLKEKYGVRALKRRMLKEARKAFMNKFGGTAIGRVVAWAAGKASLISVKIAAISTQLFTIGIWAVLILIAVYFLFLLIGVAGKFLMIPIESAARIFDGDEPYVVQGYHRLHYNQDGQDTLSNLWYTAITKDIFDSKKPNTSGFRNPENGNYFKINSYGGGDLAKGYSSFYNSDGYELAVMADWGGSISNAKTILTMADLKLSYCTGGDGEDMPGLNWSAAKYNDYIAMVFEESHFCKTKDSAVMACSGCKTYSWYCNDSTCDDHNSGTYYLTKIPVYKHDGNTCSVPAGGFTKCNGCITRYSDILGQNIKYCPGHPNDNSGKAVLIQENKKWQTQTFDAKFKTYDTDITGNLIIDDCLPHIRLGTDGNPEIIGGSVTKNDSDCDGIEPTEIVWTSGDGTWKLVYDKTNACWVIKLNSYEGKLYHNYKGYNRINPVACDKGESGDYSSVTIKTYNKKIDETQVKIGVCVPVEAKHQCTHRFTESFYGQYYSFCKGHTSKYCTGHVQLTAYGIVSFAADENNSSASTRQARKDLDNGTITQTTNLYVKVFDEIESKYWTNANKMNWFYEHDGSYLYIDMMKAKLTFQCDKCGQDIFDSYYCPNPNCVDIVDGRKTPHSVHNDWSCFGYDDVSIVSPRILKDAGIKLTKADMLTDLFTCRVSGSYYTGYSVNINSFWEKLDTLIENTFGQ